MYIEQLPVEIVREIFIQLLLQHTNSSKCHFLPEKNGFYPKYVSTRYSPYGENGTYCLCWQLDLLSISMVCRTWHSISIDLMGSHSIIKYHPSPTSWLSLLNHASYQRNYPFRSKLVKLLKESSMANLDFHRQVCHLVIDFASFDTIRREKTKNNIIIKKKVHHPKALKDMTELFKLCSQIKRLDIICDAEFTSLLSHDNSSYDHHDLSNNSILSTSKAIQKNLLPQCSIKRLDFVGFNPIQRCPCCAGKMWDKYLFPIISSLLTLDTIVFQSVLPSPQVFEILSKNSNIKTMIFYRSIITVPLQKGNRTSPRLNTTIHHIPSRLWNQVTSVEIYEDIEDSVTWQSKRYLKEFVLHVGPQLEKFVLQFETKEENEKSLSSLLNDDIIMDVIQDPNSPLHDLKLKATHLKYLKLVNVPEII
ncbi:uncharacterized protein BX663DRAFT_481865 [Cokeromyces recurvatus]|uniref:uncharacterized protein n=1 Tax=Cokeromyces recurvatus TaxID=90255 RepID=UPI00221EDC9B|nr:uncharacterized protein BX663DRAFT_481865 [Cokeromyces recurvatus]KAI7907540.1 hypothetical protein BX663DRAFT_481865 [Cokeromyces recurvatus]